MVLTFRHNSYILTDSLLGTRSMMCLLVLGIMRWHESYSTKIVCTKINFYQKIISTRTMILSHKITSRLNTSRHSPFLCFYIFYIFPITNVICTLHGCINIVCFTGGSVKFSAHYKRSRLRDAWTVVKQRTAN